MSTHTSGWLERPRIHYRDVGPAGPGHDTVLLHVHGFAISGTYLMPTALRLADAYRSIVPDLPGFGRSPRRPGRLNFADMSDQLVEVLDALDIERVTLVGNSMGCPVICEFDHRHHDRLDRAVLVSPAGGLHTRPLLRAIGQLGRDALLEDPSMARIAVPDYLRFGPIQTLRMFDAMTSYPVIERFLALSAPALAVLGSRDPLLPGPARAQELLASMRTHLDVGVIIGAAHAINYSHPEELAWLIRWWLGDGDSVGTSPATVRWLRPAS
jgi:pimeloyl-ACP methyl ester carboxylesterase